VLFCVRRAAAPEGGRFQKAPPFRGSWLPEGQTEGAAYTQAPFARNSTACFVQCGRNGGERCRTSVAPSVRLRLTAPSEEGAGRGAAVCSLFRGSRIGVAARSVFLCSVANSRPAGPATQRGAASRPTVKRAGDASSHTRGRALKQAAVAGKGPCHVSRGTVVLLRRERPATGRVERASKQVAVAGKGPCHVSRGNGDPLRRERPGGMAQVGLQNARPPRRAAGADVHSAQKRCVHTQKRP